MKVGLYIFLKVSIFMDIMLWMKIDLYIFLMILDKSI